ncbi:MAG: hypothetical protein PHD95_03130 [Candidatus ainarchaeum sp.]|nr:hypothetical protein [Candidatus ainarchaeum sp.]
MNASKYLSRTSDFIIPIPMDDRLTKEILSIISHSEKPLDTKTIVDKIRIKDKTATRTKILLRLREMKGKDIEGEMFGSGKGVWIWWKK